MLFLWVCMVQNQLVSFPLTVSSFNVYLKTFLRGGDYKYCWKKGQISTKNLSYERDYQFLIGWMNTNLTTSESNEYVLICSWFCFWYAALPTIHLLSFYILSLRHSLDGCNPLSKIRECIVAGWIRIWRLLSKMNMFWFVHGFVFDMLHCRRFSFYRFIFELYYIILHYFERWFIIRIDIWILFYECYVRLSAAFE